MNIGEKVAQQIAQSGKTIEAKVVELLAAKEVERRVQATLTAYAEVDETEKALKKLKPDVVAYSETGEVVSSNWSKAKLDERNKLQEKLKKLTNSIDKALDKGDFSDLFNLKKPTNEPATA